MFNVYTVVKSQFFDKPQPVSLKNLHGDNVRQTCLYPKIKHKTNQNETTQVVCSFRHGQL